MPRTRQPETFATTLGAIKMAARSLMAAHGTAGISIRAIARQMGLTPPAIYTYFARLDDLITALIVENFNALADTIAQASQAHAGEDVVTQLIAALLAYREWALNNPVDFQLIYGNPIPGYSAPGEITVPAAARTFEVLVGLIEAILHSERYTPRAPFDHIPPEAEAQIAVLIARDGYPVSPMALYLGTVGWGQLHGLIMLELFHHLGPVVGDESAFYRAQIVNLLLTFGIDVRGR